MLPKYFEARPNAKKQYAFLDKRTEAISVKSSIDTSAAEPATEAVEAAPVAEAPAEAVAENA